MAANLYNNFITHSNRILNINVGILFFKSKYGKVNVFVRRYSTIYKIDEHQEIIILSQLVNVLPANNCLANWIYTG